MAEVNTDQGGKGKGGKKRSKKVSTKIDMTPMVDLAFLLITFFMYTTTMSKPNTMNLNMPDKTKDNKEQAVSETDAFNLLLGEGDMIYWYQGLNNPKVEVTDFSQEGIRKVLLEKKAANPKLTVIIKAVEKARYKNMVDILDELHIDGIQKFAIVDISEVDLKLIENKKNEVNTNP